MTAPKVKPFEHSCGTCGQTVKKVSVEGLIPMTVEEARHLGHSLLMLVDAIEGKPQGTWGPASFMDLRSNT